MIRLILLAICIGVLSPRPGCGEDPVMPPGPAVSPVLFPQFVQPMREIDPGVVPTIQAEQWYVVSSDTEFFLLASPAGIVNVTYESGPIRLRGTFVDSGKLETRRIEAKFVAIVDAVDGAVGRVELIAVPRALTAEADITRRLIDVGQGPRPPPKPIEPTLSPTAKVVADALTGPQGKADATILLAASEQIAERMDSFKDGKELLETWGKLLAANHWMKGSRKEIAAMIGQAIPAGEAKPFTADDRKRLTALFIGIVDGCEAVLK